MVRVWKFSLFAASGITIISLTTGYVMWREYTTTIAGREPTWFLILMIGVVGLFLNVMALFLVIEEYVHRELEAREIANIKKEER